MRIPYARMPEGDSFQWMPYLTVGLVGPTSRLRLPMLVDSGSMESMIPDRFLRLLGVPIDGEQMTMVGAGGKAFVGRVAQVRIEFGPHSVNTRVVAVPGQVKAPPILGHRDFFQTFWVGFDTAGRGFHVSPARKRLPPSQSAH